MAKKSKTQRAKANAKRAEKREQAKVAEEEEANREPEPVKEKGKVTQLLEKTPLKRTDEEKAEAIQYKKEQDEQEAREKEEKKKNKKEHFLFFKNVRSEMKRVTWPSRKDVGRWSLVVVGALVFFTVFVLVMDNWIVTPILYLISSLG